MVTKSPGFSRLHFALRAQVGRVGFAEFHNFVEAAVQDRRSVRGRPAHHVFNA